MNKLFIKLVLSCMFICMVNVAAYVPAGDYKMQCLYLYKFSQLVEWPENKSRLEFNIGIVGTSPMIPQLEQYINTKNRYSAVKYKIERFASAQAVTNCDLLYITREQSVSFEMIVKSLNGKPTLLVAELPGLIRRGACINMIAEEGSSIKIQINKSAIESHRLKVSPDFIKLGNEFF